jgi:putative addiction module CopG family antidote
MAEFMDRKVASGEYPDESEVIRESLILLEDRDQSLERWLREEVVPVCLELEADPSKGLALSEVCAGLEAARRERQKPA